MTTIFKIASACVLLSCALIADAASAAPVGLSKAAGVHQSLTQEIYYRRGLRGRGWYGPRYRGVYRRRWYGPRVGIYGGYGYGYGGGGCRAVCASRWGWGGPGFRRCVWNRC